MVGQYVGEEVFALLDRAQGAYAEYVIAKHDSVVSKPTTLERFEERARDIDLVFDLVAGETQQRSWSVLKDGGRIVSTLQPRDKLVAPGHAAALIQCLPFAR